MKYLFAAVLTLATSSVFAGELKCSISQISDNVESSLEYGYIKVKDEDEIPNGTKGDTKTVTITNSQGKKVFSQKVKLSSVIADNFYYQKGDFQLRLLSQRSQNPSVDVMITFPAIPRPLYFEANKGCIEVIDEKM